MQNLTLIEPLVNKKKQSNAKMLRIDNTVQFQAMVLHSQVSVQEYILSFY